jgi:hypothetical protein
VQIDPIFYAYFGKVSKLFKKDWEQALYHILISIVTVAPIILLFYVPYFIFIFSVGDQHSYGATGDP